MKNKIVLGHAGNRKIELDLGVLLITRLLIQANSGGGKSWLLRLIAELLFGKVQTFIVDPEGEFASLREKHGYVLVGEGGETVADPRSAPLLAERLLELGASAIFDLYETFRGRPYDQRLWVWRFLQALVNAPKKLWHPLVVIVDESHKFCPEENPKGGNRRRPDGLTEREIIMGCKEAMIALATTGRKRGFCAVWATQRLAKLDKDASGELFNRLVGLTFEDVDVARAISLLGVSREDQAEFKKAIKVLEPGNFHAFGRAITKERTLFKVASVETSHPESGAAAAAAGPPPMPKEIQHLLPKLADLPQEADTRAKTEADLKAEIKRLQTELAKKPMAAPPAVAPAPKVKEVVVPLMHKEQVANLEKALEGLHQEGNRIIAASNDLQGGLTKYRDLFQQTRQPVVAGGAQVGRAGTHTPRPTPPAPRASTDVGSPEDAALDKCARAILAVLAQHGEGCVARKLTVLSGYRWTGGFRNSLGALRRLGYIEGDNGQVMKIKAAGIQAIDGQWNPLPVGRLARLEYWLHHPSFGVAERKIVQALADHPGGLTAEELVAETGYRWTGGFRNSLGSVRTAGILVGRNTETMRLCDELQEEV
jgi:hypothetical protein